MLRMYLQRGLMVCALSSLSWSGVSAQCSDDGATPVPGPSSHASGIVSDDFNRCTLAPMWTLSDPRGDAVLGAQGVGSGDAAVTLLVPPGISHNPWDDGVRLDTAPSINQPANNTDFELEIKFASSLLDSLTGHGIRVTGDDGDFLRFGVYFSNGDYKAFMSSTGGTVEFNGDIGGTEAPSYMRVRRDGDNFFLSISYDGITYDDVDWFDDVINVVSVGFHAINEEPNPLYDLAVDYFVNLAEPLENEDNPAGGGGGDDDDDDDDGDDDGGEGDGDQDGDGIPDADDRCDNSDLRDKVWVGDCNTGVDNFVLPRGCSVNDRLARFAERSDSGRDFFRRTLRFCRNMVRRGLLSRYEAFKILRCVYREHVHHPHCGRR
ncbi:MAG: hypothetical protein AAF517_12725 [Planctomycetota bacterium]